MKLSQLSLADYNKLANIPVINQDLSASGFTPVANTYYRHTGATTDTFTQGVIYLYDTAYHKLGESGGGGTTLNKYTFTCANTQASRLILYNICQNAKGKVQILMKDFSLPCSWTFNAGSDLLISGFKSSDGPANNYQGVSMQIHSNGNCGNSYITNGTTGSFLNNQTYGMLITYWNDTEITA